MRVLIGCEESGKVRDAFIARGHDAWSNDLVPARNGGNHLQMCVTKAIKDYGPWDIIILHYDCTKTAVSGNRWYGKNTQGYKERLEDISFACALWELAKQHALIGCAYENPVSVIWDYIGKPQYIQPWHFGHKETKKTGLRLHKLPFLKPTHIVGPPPIDPIERKSWERIWRMPRSVTRKRDRAETYSGIAEAMADQWGRLTSDTTSDF